MAARPILNKQVAKLRKSMRMSPPAFIDLVQWLQKVGEDDILAPFVPAKLRAELIVLES